MNFKLLIVLLVSFLTSVNCVNKENLKLDLIQVIFRHGARTPSQIEVTAVNITDTSIYKPHRLDQLINLGKNQLYELGRQLRIRYEFFLGKYKLKDVYAYTSHTTRTKMSLQLVLAGLYPPDSGSQWNPALNWTPVPFHQSSYKVDLLLTPHSSPRFMEIYLSEVTKIGVGFKEDVIEFIAALYNVIKIHKLMQLPLPDWVNDGTLETFQKLLVIGYETFFHTKKQKTLFAGNLIGQIIKNIEQNAEISRKIYLYSSHDVTLGGFQIANDIKITKIPAFGSAIIIESYKDNQNNDYIKMISWDGEGLKYEELKPKDCEEDYCPLKNYKDSVEEIIPSMEELQFLLT